MNNKIILLSLLAVVVMFSYFYDEAFAASEPRPTADRTGYSKNGINFSFDQLIDRGDTSKDSFDYFVDGELKHVQYLKFYKRSPQHATSVLTAYFSPDFPTNSEVVIRYNSNLGGLASQQDKTPVKSFIITKPIGMDARGAWSMQYGITIPHNTPGPIPDPPQKRDGPAAPITTSMKVTELTPSSITINFDAMNINDDKKKLRFVAFLISDRDLSDIQKNRILDISKYPMEKFTVRELSNETITFTTQTWNNKAAPLEEGETYYIKMVVKSKRSSNLEVVNYGAVTLPLVQ